MGNKKYLLDTNVLIDFLELDDGLTLTSLPKADIDADWR